MTLSILSAAVACAVLVGASAAWFLRPSRRNGKNVKIFIATALAAPLVVGLAYARGDPAATAFVLLAYPSYLLPLALSVLVWRVVKR